MRSDRCSEGRRQSGDPIRRRRHHGVLDPFRFSSGRGPQFDHFKRHGSAPGSATHRRLDFIATDQGSDPGLGRRRRVQAHGASGPGAGHVSDLRDPVCRLPSGIDPAGLSFGHADLYHGRGNERGRGIGRDHDIGQYPPLSPEPVLLARVGRMTDELLDGAPMITIQI